MTRATIYLVLFAIVAGVVAWLVGQPGAVSLVWHGYRVDTSVGVLIAVVLLASATLAALYLLWRFLRRVPGAIARYRRESRRLKGYRALTQGMVAVAAGDPNEARRQARRADLLLNEPPLTMLLSAQAAQLNGDEAAAEKYFVAMLARRETEFLGLRGLAMIATKQGDTRKALAFVRRARTLRPKTGWVLTMLHDLETRAGDWQAAEETARLAVRAGAIGSAAGARQRALAYYQQSLAAQNWGNRDESLALARKAVALEPGFVPAVLRAADLLAARGKRRRALHIIEEAWQRTPHPDLATAYLAIDGETNPLKRLMAIQRLVTHRPVDPESHLALAEAALAARLWGEARRALESLKSLEGDGAPPSARACRLWATLEEAEHQDGTAARVWLARAAKGEPDSSWLCGQCGVAHPSWTPLCSRCGAYDALAWGNPAKAAHQSGAAGTLPPSVAAEPTAPQPAEAVTDLGV